MNPEPTRTVVVLDRAAQDAAWGRGGGGLVFRTVTLVWICPSCFGPRGEPSPRRFCEDGEFYWVDCWQNPCGHVDHYPEVLREAEQLLELARLEGQEA
jgi:hypothetical protein